MYHCTCPVCRKGHDVDADFLSTSRTLLDTDGRPGLSYNCGAHTPTELRAAWSTPTAPSVRSSVERGDALAIMRGERS